MQGDTGRALALIDDAGARFHDASYHISTSLSSCCVAMWPTTRATVGGNGSATRMPSGCHKDSFRPIVIALALRGVALCALHQDDLASAEDAIEAAQPPVLRYDARDNGCALLGLQQGNCLAARASMPKRRSGLIAPAGWLHGAAAGRPLRRCRGLEQVGCHAPAGDNAPGPASTC